MNMTETKYTMRDISNRMLKKPIRTTNIEKSQAESDYEKKKAAEHKAVHDEIKRVSLQQSLV